MAKKKRQSETPIDDALRAAITARIKRGETIVSISEGSGVPHPQISRYVSGARPTLSVKTADKLAVYLGLVVTVRE